MEDRSKARFLVHNYKNEETGETVRGVTVMLDGTMKQLIESLHEVFPEYPDDVALIKEALFRGINSMIEEAKENG